MKKKQLSNQRQSQSPKHKVSQSESSDELVQSFINLLTEKVNEMHGMINKIEVNPPSNSEALSISSTLPEATLLKSESLTSSPLSNDFLSEEFDLNDIRLQINTENSEIGDDGSRLGAAGSTIQNNSASNSGQSSAAILHRTSYNYASTRTTNYRYEFTNYEFFAFIGSLDPVEYILVVTIIAIIIGVQLNVYERQILGGTLVDIGVTLGNMVEQELFRSARRNEIINRERNEAEQNDFDTLYNDIDRLQNEINTLKQQLGINQT